MNPPKVTHNLPILNLLTELETVVHRATAKWTNSDPVPKTLKLLDDMSVQIYLLKQFVAEDSMVAVQVAWKDEIFGPVAFDKAFYGQGAIGTEAKMLRDKILKAIIARISK